MAAPKTVASIRDLSIKQRTVLLRVDFNVPLKNRVVADTTRIAESLPTIRYAMGEGAKVVLASHLGRPEGKVDERYSMEPVAHALAQLLEKEVTLAEDCIGEGIEMMAKWMKGGDVLLLENLRFHAGEESNDPVFAHSLARLAEVYVTDAFGTAHRKHASTYGVPSFMQEKGAGFLVEKELKFFDALLKAPEKPFWALLGGSKVSDKLKTVESLLERVQGIAIGGAMAFAFMRAAGQQEPRGGRAPLVADVEAAGLISREAKRRGVRLLLPIDFRDSFDIGPDTVKRYSDAVSDAKTIFWNGPMGKFEEPEYAEGTHNLARAISTLSAVKVVGGGDTVSAIKGCGVADKFDHLSTGGGAVLEYLEGRGLPGIDVLKT